MALHKQNRSLWQFLSIILLFASPLFLRGALAQNSGYPYSIMHTFGDGSVANDGGAPETALTLGPDGNFYGTTSGGGTAGYGSVFKMTPSGSVTILHSFYDGSIPGDGINPQADLVLGSDGNFYGTTYTGGSKGPGTVFKMTPSGNVTILHSFQDGSIADDGAHPQSRLVIASDGNFYGTTQDGGSSSDGTVFKINIVGNVTILHSFGDRNVANDGINPRADLTLASDGNFYGTTRFGGYRGNGTAFKITPAGVITILHSFQDGFSIQNDGINPNSTLTLGSDGNFYGTTYGGGLSSKGTVFKMTLGGTVTILHLFGDGSVANDGANPYSRLLLGSDGNFYGTTFNGGAANSGTAFKMTPGGTVTILHSFRGGSVTNDGANPFAGLIQDFDGNLYGTTQNGGVAGMGTVYRLSREVKLVVSTPTSATLDVPIFFTVSAADPSGNTQPSYSGTIHFSSSDPSAILPADTTLINGSGTLSATFKTAGSETIMVTDVGSPYIANISNKISVSPGPATTFSISSITTTLAGASLAMAVNALDTNGNIATGYTGTVRFSSSDSKAILPTNTTLTGGTGTFVVKLKTAGLETITATDAAAPSIHGTSQSIAVTSSPAIHFSISAPASASAGTPFNYTLKALDQFGNTDTNYDGTVHFTSSDSAAFLPADTTLTNGSGNLSATLVTAGNQAISATDTDSDGITGTSGQIAVMPASTAHFVIGAPASILSGSAFGITVAAQDQYGNPAYMGTIHFSSSDPGAILPLDMTLFFGTGVQITLRTAGTQTITVTDTSNPANTATVNIAVVNPGPTMHLTITAPSAATAGIAFNAVVTAKDQFNNTLSSYTGTIHLTSSDGQAVLPTDFVLTGGTKQISVKLRTPGTQTITAMDGTGLAAMTAGINVGVVASKYVIAGPSTATSGASSTYSVTATDALGNPATNYTGTAHITTTDTNAVVPGNVAIVNGSGSFQITFTTAATEYITATDTVTPSIKGPATVVVSAGTAASFVIAAPASVTSGTAFVATVTAKDAYGNIAKSYTGMVHFTSSDALAVLPANTTLTSGMKQVSIKLKNKGSQTLTTVDAINSGVAGTSPNIAVN